jgi:hypothetical protein
MVMLKVVSLTNLALVLTTSYPALAVPSVVDSFRPESVV